MVDPVLLSFGTFDSFLADLAQKSSVRCILLWPNNPINQLEPVQQSKQQALRAYCPNIYALEYAHDGRWKGVMKGRNSAQLSSFSLEPHQILRGPSLSPAAICNISSVMAFLQWWVKNEHKKSLYFVNTMNVVLTKI